MCKYYSLQGTRRVGNGNSRYTAPSSSSPPTPTLEPTYAPADKPADLLLHTYLVRPRIVAEVQNLAKLQCMYAYLHTYPPTSTTNRVSAPSIRMEMNSLPRAPPPSQLSSSSPPPAASCRNSEILRTSQINLKLRLVCVAM